MQAEDEKLIQTNSHLMNGLQWITFIFGALVLNFP